MSIEIVTMQMCHTLQGTMVEIPSDKEPGVIYAVWTGAVDESIPTCECRSFKYSSGVDKRGNCKHIRKALRNLCGWHPQWADERQSSRQAKNMVCPRCGGRTVACKVGV